jgi:hypothetical protein
MLSFCPYPRISFVLPSFYGSISDKAKPSQIVKDLYEKKFLGPLSMKSMNDKNLPYRYISAYQIFRGKLNKFEINKSLIEYSKNLKVCDITSSCAFTSDFLNTPAVETKSCVRLANNSCISETLGLYIDRLENICEKDKSKLSPYFELGMEEYSLTEAISNFSDRKREYEDICLETVNDEEVQDN